MDPLPYPDTRLLTLKFVELLVYIGHVLPACTSLQSTEYKVKYGLNKASQKRRDN